MLRRTSHCLWLGMALAAGVAPLSAQRPDPAQPVRVPGSVTAAGSAAPRRGASIHPGELRLGAGLDVNYFSQFQSTVGDQPDIKSFRGDNISLGFTAFAEYRPSSLLGHRPPLFLGAAVHYGTQDFSQTFQSANPRVPSMVTGSVRGLFYDAYGGYTRSVGRLGVQARLGATYSCDRAHVTSRYGNIVQIATRTHGAWMTDFGASLDFPLVRRFSGRAGLNYTTSFASPDADTHTHVNLSVFRALRASF